MILLLLDSALACGGMMPQVGQVVASDAQQTIMTIGSQTVSVEYRVRYTGSAQDFAWVIPVPGEILAVEEGDETRFSELELLTGPTIWEPDPYTEPGCTCIGAGSDRAGGDTGQLSNGGVTITGSGFAGDYSYVTLTAEDADGLMTWLTDNGYDGSLAAEDIAAYVDDTIGYNWVAVQVRPEAAELDADVVFTPLKITYGAGDDDKLHASFPARMARTSTAETNRIELYIDGESFADMGGGWTAISDLSIQAMNADEAADRYAERLASLGGETRAFALVWGGSYDGRYITRYDTIVAPGTQTTAPELTLTGAEWNFETTITVDDESGSSASVGFIGLLGLLRRFRRR